MSGVQTECRLCRTDKLTEVIDLGHHPLADTFLFERQLHEPQTTYPLGVFLCKECGHTMTTYVVSPEERYQKNEYSYDSSNSKVSIEHFGEMAKQAVAKLGITKDDLVVDIGSNVGTLLGAFRAESGSKVLGIEPSSNIAAIALKNDIPTLEGFFDMKMADKILETGRPKVVATTNVLNHADETDEFVKAIAYLVADSGVLVFEVPYLLDLVEKTSFDTIYLEHVSYFAVKPLVQYLKKFELSVIHIEVSEYMGGSLRVYAQKNGTETEDVAFYCKKEESAGLFKEETYKQFMNRVEDLKFRLCTEIYAAKKNGEKIIGIGAATKGNTLLNYCKIDQSLLEYITDSSVLKIGKYTPGSYILIKDDKEITDDITHALILPWNIAPFLKTKLSHHNLKFITPQL